MDVQEKEPINAIILPRRPKLTIEQQVEHLKNKGVTFALCTEEQAVSFLKYSTFFFKVKAFDKDYEINPKTGKYLNLDFAYLMELSTLDMHLRRLILHATLDLEHYLKVMLIREISENPNEDGYKIVERFFNAYPDVKASIGNKSENSMCRDLIQKLQKEGYAVWNLIEVISFGDLVKLCEMYDQNTGGKNEDLFRCLFAVRCLRNAAAHNNCLLNSMRAPYTRKIKPSRFLTHFASTIPGVKETSREKKMSNPVIHDFIGLLFVYDKIVTSAKTREHFASELHQLFDERMVKRKEYFQKNEVLVSSYSFVMKAINQLYPIKTQGNNNTLQ